MTVKSMPLRTVLGVLAKDVPRYWRALRQRGDGWLAVRNRHEQLEAAPDGSGYRCNWQWTSDLHAPKVIPWLGRRLMQQALAAHPVRRAASPAANAGDPQVSFVVGHRGRERVAHLAATLESIAAQQGARVECIVVQQDADARVPVPAWVHVIQTPPPGMPYSRSWGLQHRRPPCPRAGPRAS
jgi:hypothetical protein